MFLEFALQHIFFKNNPLFTPPPSSSFLHQNKKTAYYNTSSEVFSVSTANAYRIYKRNTHNYKERKQTIENKTVIKLNQSKFQHNHAAKQTTAAGLQQQCEEHFFTPPPLVHSQPPLCLRRGL